MMRSAMSTSGPTIAITKPSGAPGDGSVWMGGDCNLRILRGGAWNDTIIYGLGVPIAMIAAHNTYPVDARNYANGFRVVRTLN